MKAQQIKLTSRLQIYNSTFNSKQDFVHYRVTIGAMYITLRRVRLTTVLVEKQYYIF
jgi:hypothetical protein